MRRPRVTSSFRAKLALRIAAITLIAAAAVGALLHVSLRRILLAQLDATLVRLAEIEAAATADASGSDVHFHEGIFLAAEGEALPEVSRFAEVWDDEGNPVLRSANLEGRDLPLAAGVLEAALRGEALVRTDDWAGEPVRSVVYPLGRIGPAHRHHVLQVSASLVPTERVLGRFLALLLATGVAVAALASAGAWLLAGHAIRPAREIAAQAARIEAGLHGERITAHADEEEFRSLVDVLNRMLERLGAAFEAERRFVADASHEIRHPLAALRARLEIALRRERSAEEYREVLRDGLEEVDRIGALAEGLLTLARADAGVLEPNLRTLDARALARRVVDRHAALAAERGIALALADGPPVPLDADASLLERALSNLVHNAVKLVPPGGRVDVRVEADGDTARLAVEDSGPGVPPEARARLFERFYRGDASRGRTGGAGLGLAITRSIARAHDGDVVFRPTPSGGSIFALDLPRARQTARV
ncbi:MAG TPA: ATP-binding protein [Longimicrobiales bacterium]